MGASQRVENCFHSSLGCHSSGVGHRVVGTERVYDLRKSSSTSQHTVAMGAFAHLQYVQEDWACDPVSNLAGALQQGRNITPRSGASSI